MRTPAGEPGDVRQVGIGTVTLVTKGQYVGGLGCVMMISVRDDDLSKLKFRWGRGRHDPVRTPAQSGVFGPSAPNRVALAASLGGVRRWGALPAAERGRVCVHALSSTA